MAFGDSEFAQRQEGAVSSISISHPPCKVIAPPSCMAPRQSQSAYLPLLPWKLVTNFVKRAGQVSHDHPFHFKVEMRQRKELPYPES